ncbi:serine/threonine-protein kinase PknD [Mycobacterium ostraviense]|uniref:serine/threonine-protein kinase PknD n=2 Tax=Mycobacterium ostraviense TaxID=2738409 RepID=UPI000C08C943|nr:serine/threonine-protein kinase PknD [Mycobacterium ostraviense]UGT90410.1 serine/threonine-protein kinase PknD [Mycobacterium ostraviense]
MTDARTGARFGPYELRRLLGRGGMGEVYEAEDTRKRRVVALKLISPEFSGDPVFRARMQREADAAGRLTEPHVVPIHDYGEIDGKLFLEMRLVDGTDLATLLKRSGPLSPARAVVIVRQIAAALDAAHTTGVTHRDVKPENILITDDDFAYLVDFGIARAATDPGLTRAGIAMGTYSYMAPERFTGDEVTYRADIYSLACVLNECLTGSPPYPTDSIERAVGAHLTQPAPQPSRLRPGQVPQAFDAVIAKGMAKNPVERYRSAGELAAAAHQALSGPEQDQATTILRQLDEDTDSPVGGLGGALADPAPGFANTPLGPAQPHAETMAAPVPPGAGSWRDRPRPAPPAGPAGPPGFGQPPRVPAPDFAPGAPRPRSKRTLWILVGAAALLVVAAVGYVVARPSHPSTPASGQTVLPFMGIDFRLSPGGVAVDTAGNVYVTSEGMYGRVVKLAIGSSTATVLPFNGLYQPQGLAVDGAGAIYVTDFNNRVVMLPAGSNSQTVLPFDGLDYPEGVAVDTQGSVYVADRGNNRVVKLAAGAETQTVLPFDGLKNPDGVAVDGAGNIYVADTDNNRVVKLDARSNNQTVLPFRELSVPWGIAVDTVGNVYVTEHNKNDVVKLAAGSNTATVLPFTGLNTPLAVAVDGSGNVYVADRGNDRAVKLTL